MALSGDCHCPLQLHRRSNDSSSFLTREGLFQIAPSSQPFSERLVDAAPPKQKQSARRFHATEAQVLLQLSDIGDRQCCIAILERSSELCNFLTRKKIPVESPSQPACEAARAPRRRSADRAKSAKDLPIHRGADLGYGF